MFPLLCCLHMCDLICFLSSWNLFVVCYWHFFYCVGKSCLLPSFPPSLPSFLSFHFFKQVYPFQLLIRIFEKESQIFLMWLPSWIRCLYWFSCDWIFNDEKRSSFKFWHVAMSVFTGTWYKKDGWLHYDYLNFLLCYYALILRDYADKGSYFSTCFMIFIFLYSWFLLCYRNVIVFIFLMSPKVLGFSHLFFSLIFYFLFVFGN